MGLFVTALQTTDYSTTYSCMSLPFVSYTYEDQRKFRSFWLSTIFPNIIT